MGVQKHHKKRFAKNCVEKFLPKNRQKIQNRFFDDFFYHVFGHFLVRGFFKHHLLKKIGEINLALVFVWPMTHPPTTEVAGLRLGCWLLAGWLVSMSTVCRPSA
jgi:hypothetical protein